MRLAPVVEVRVAHLRTWRTALMIGASLALFATFWWMREAVASVGTSVSMQVCVSGLGLGSVILCLCEAFGCRPFALRWDGQAWWYLPLGGSGGVIRTLEDGRSGELRVAVDLGVWMLLRWQPTGGARRSTMWLPVQQSELQARWHALRCAVYSPRSPTATSSLLSSNAATPEPMQ